MKKLISCFLLFSLQAQASIFIEAKGGAEPQADLASICRQMTTDHLSDIAELNRLNQELFLLTKQDDLAGNSETITNLVAQIKEYSVRIQHLANPEWNMENIPVTLYWDVPYSLFFDNSPYLKFKDEIGEYDPPIDSLDLGAKYGPRFPRPVYAKTFFPKVKTSMLFASGPITGKKINKAYFLNFENQDITEYLTLDSVVGHRTEAERDRGFMIVYRKNVTALEACQFLKTLVFEIEIEVSSMDSPAGLYAKGNTKIYLVNKK